MRRITLVFYGILLAWVLGPDAALADYYCSVCGRSFSNARRAREHVEKQHDGKGTVRSYSADGTCIYTGGVCPGCKREFRSPAHYRKHLDRCKHTPPGGPPTAATRPVPPRYHCQKCGLAFDKHEDAARHAAQCTAKPGQADTDGAAEPTPPPPSAPSSARRPVAGPDDDVVVLKNGERFVGDILSVTESGVKMKTPYGAEVVFATDQVEEILGAKASDFRPSGTAEKSEQ